MGYCRTGKVLLGQVFILFITRTRVHRQKQTSPLLKFFGKVCLLIFFFSWMTLLFTVSFMNTKALIDFCFLLRYAALAPLYYRGAAVAVIVYDITSPETFNKAQYWVKVVCLDPDFILSLSLSLAHIPISSSFSSSLSHTC